MTRQSFERQCLENQGYWDGRLWAELRKPYLFTHFSPIYLKGWQRGYDTYKAEQHAPRTPR